MEEKSKKNIYFLYSQKGDKNNVQAIETNDKVIKVNEIHKEIYDNYKYISNKYSRRKLLCTG